MFFRRKARTVAAALSVFNQVISDLDEIQAEQNDVINRHADDRPNHPTEGRGSS